MEIYKKAWVVDVSMGYGHQRTAYPLRYLAEGGKVINANDYDGIPPKDRRVWESSRKFYEFISRIKRIPLIGEAIFSAYDKFQEILSYYPKRDLSNPNIQLKQIYSLIKGGWGRHLILRLGSRSSGARLASEEAAGQVEKPIPIITTFFIPAFMAEFFNYPGEIFCIVCDADISRTWAPLMPQKSRIKYFAPTDRVAERLKLYGVKEENIFLTGYPLPMENIGSEQMEILKEDLGQRLLNLDPKGKYCEQYKILIEKTLGLSPKSSGRILTLMFAIGGAGAQKEIAVKIVESLSEKISSGKIKIVLVAGIRKEVKEYLEKGLKRLSFDGRENVEILFAESMGDYFQRFNQSLRKTDILWTKPSELSFYSALGLPIIMAPSIGSQEQFNKRWLLKSGFGNLQENPKHAYQWLFDWIDQGYLAESAMEGFIESEKMGTVNIQKICFG